MNSDYRRSWDIYRWWKVDLTLGPTHVLVLRDRGNFMRATGRLYGLDVDWYVDERRDPLKSTVAAAHHLRDLYDRFGSWPLALAAYNAGSGKVSRAIRKGRTDDFWKIRRTRYIRRETKEYVPRFIAATMIAMNPSDYGFLINPVEPHEYEEVMIGKRVHLRSVAKATGISVEELKELNPELRRSIIPHRSTRVSFESSGRNSDTGGRRAGQIPTLDATPHPLHRLVIVCEGVDSLSVVARRFGMTVRALKDLNHLSGNMIRAGKRLKGQGW